MEFPPPPHVRQDIIPYWVHSPKGRKRVKIFDNNFNYCLHRIPNGKKENDLWIFDNIAASCCKTFVVFTLDSFLTFMGPKLTSLGPMSLELHVTSLRPPMISLILPAPVTYLRTQVTFLRPKVTPRGLNWPLWGSKWLLWVPGCTGCHHIQRAKYQQNNRATNHISLSLSFWIHLESSLSYFTFLPPFPAPLYLCQLVCCCLLVCLSLFSTFYLSILPLIFKSISGWLKL